MKEKERKETLRGAVNSEIDHSLSFPCVLMAELLYEGKGVNDQRPSTMEEGSEKIGKDDVFIKQNVTSDHSYHKET